MNCLFVLASLLTLGVLAVSGNVENRIVDALAAAPGQFRYQASLRNQSNGHFCGASIIKPYYVLTSAKCVYGKYPQSVYVVVGTNDLVVGGTHLSVSSIISHERYDSSTFKNNIALVKTTGNMLSVPQTSSVALNIASTYPGQKAVLSGWGKELLSLPTYSNHLRYAEFYVLSLDDCKRELRDYPVDYDNICTKASRAGGCDGDNGGPLVSTDRIQIGVLSWGIPCAVGTPDVYTSVSQHYGWIEDHSFN
ncbi:chymotrypsin-1-like [Photinus pyralis]|nr:chymotrypsin-1-like [Photinus pyralis]